MKRAAGVSMHVDNCLGSCCCCCCFYILRFTLLRVTDTLWSLGDGADEDHMARASLDWFIILIIIILILLIILIIACIVLRSRGDTYPGQQSHYAYKRIPFTVVIITNYCNILL